VAKKKSNKKKQGKRTQPPKSQPNLLPGLGGGPWSPKQAEPPKPVGRMEMERLNRAMSKLLAEKDFADADEANAFLASFTGRPIDEILAEIETDPEEEAQELAFQAMDSDSLTEQRSLCRKALELDPHCIDALLIKASLNTRSIKDYTARLHKIVRDAEQRFGAEYIEENPGHFWGMTETRPYMRARQALVMALGKCSQLSEAIAECEGMLELNPNDNQGIRDSLRSYYLQTDNLEGVRRLNKEYSEDILATYTWSVVLERWLSGEEKQAEKTARAGHKRNPHVAAYLTGEQKLPKRLPEYYSPGDANEAIACAESLGNAWRVHPEAVAWLKGLALK